MTTSAAGIRLRTPHAGQWRPRGVDVRHSVIRHSSFRHGSRGAFTLAEILIVVAIMAIMMTLSIPAIRSTMRQDSFRKTVADIIEGCTHARSQAILTGVPVFLRIRPGDRTLEVVQGGGPVAADQTPEAEGEGSKSPAARFTGFTGHISERADIIELAVNFVAYKDAEECRVRFFPNGTSDEFAIILRSDEGENRMIMLEVITGLPQLESDPTQFTKMR